MKDLKGYVSGELKVIKYMGKNDNGHNIWLCLCSCGKEKIIKSSNLLNGKTKSCGHLKKYKSICEVGNVFGYSKILAISDKPTNGNGVYVHCRCLLCGTEFEANLGNLKKGFCQSCGCAKFVTLVDKRFGNLVVTEFSDKDAYGHSIWVCRCDCGNEILATTSNLNTGRMISCGCMKRAAANEMIGKIYGHSKVLKILDETSFNGATIAECQCLQCVNIFQVQTHTLKKGFESSCGCYRKTIESKEKKGLFNGTNLPNLLSPNLYKTNKTGVRGVQERNGKYRAMIRFQNKMYHLGTYETPKDAANARKIAEEELLSPTVHEYLTTVENKGEWIEKFKDNVNRLSLEANDE